MERRADEHEPPWRVLGEAPVPPTEPIVAGGLRMPVLTGGIAATILLAVVAFLLAGATSDGSVVRVDGALVGAGNGVGNAGAAGTTTDGVAGAGGVPGAGPVATTELVVDVGGAVARPGVYRLPPGARVGDAIAAAGGFGTRVDAARASAELNLAAVVADGDRIRVPSRDDPLPTHGGGTGATGSGSGSGSGSGATGDGTGAGGLIDLNTATSAQLEELPGIGPVTAGKIIAAREEQPFRSVDELRSRGVLGPATYAKVVDLVIVR